MKEADIGLSELFIDRIETVINLGELVVRLVKLVVDPVELFIGLVRTFHQCCQAAAEPGRDPA